MSDSVNLLSGGIGPGREIAGSIFLPENAKIAKHAGALPDRQESLSLSAGAVDFLR